MYPLDCPIKILHVLFEVGQIQYKPSLGGVQWQAEDKKLPIN
jgi:hypothetical protein